MKHRIKVTQAAELMGVSPQFVRIGLQQGQLPIGYAVKVKTKWTYYISPKKFEEVTGIKIEEEQDEEGKSAAAETDGAA